MHREDEFRTPGEGSPTGEGVGERAGETVERARERVGEAMEDTRERAAGRVEEAGSRLRERGREMEQEGGVKSRVGQAAERGGDALEHGADYLRTHDFASMRDDLTEQIRERPLLSIGAALGAGYLLGRIVRG